MPWTAARRWSPPEGIATGVAAIADRGTEYLLADPSGDWIADQWVLVDTKSLWF